MTSKRKASQEVYKQPDIIAQRRETVAELLAKGYNPSAILKEITQNSQLQHLVGGCVSVYQLIRRDVAYIGEKGIPVLLHLSPEEGNRALHEYAVRLNAIYTDAWQRIHLRQYDGIYEYRELVKLAAAAAKDKARAMGVNTDIPTTKIPAAGELPPGGQYNFNLLPGANPQSALELAWAMKKAVEDIGKSDTIEGEFTPSGTPSNSLVSAGD